MSLRQSECHQVIVLRFFRDPGVTASGNHYVLLAMPAQLIGHRRGLKTTPLPVVTAVRDVARVEHPSNLEEGYVAAIDLGVGRIARAPRIVAISWPLAGGCRGLGAARRNRDEGKDQYCN